MPQYYFLICHTFQSCCTINNQLKSLLRLQHSYICFETIRQMALNRLWASKLLSTQITMKICDNFVTASFCLALPHCREMQLGKKWFWLPKFYILLSLRKKHLYCFTFSHKLSAIHNNWSLSLEKKREKNQQQQQPTLFYSCLPVEQPVIRGH